MIERFFDRFSQRPRARIGPGKTGQRDAFSLDAVGEFRPVCGAEGRNARDARIGHGPAATEQWPTFLTWYGLPVHAYFRASRSSRQACSQRRQACSQIRQCSCIRACRSHSSPQLLQMATQASSRGLVTAAS